MSQRSTAWSSIPEMAAGAADTFGTRSAIEDGQTRLTFAGLLAEAESFGAALVAAGVGPGDRVAIWAPNCAEWVVAFLGISMAGSVLVPINTRFKGREAADLLERTQAKALVTVTDFLQTDYVAMLRASEVVLPELRTIVVARGDAPVGTESWGGFLARATDEDRAVVNQTWSDLGPDDLSDILFTSGTTGQPKGVMMTHGRTLCVATDWVAMTGLNDEDRYLMINPYFHMFGLKAGILACLASGATMLPEPVFDVARILDRVGAEGITVLPGPPTLYQSILDHPDRSRFDLSTLRVAVTGAADIPVELIRRVNDELPFSSIITGYGLTEAGTAVATLPNDDVETIATTVGRPRPGFEVRIVENGQEVATGQPGAVLLRGGSVMAGYLNDPEATGKALSPDGWLSTGDIGVLTDEGNLRIVGRSKDMFIVGGFNAYPAEIENALLRHPDIAQAAVIGIPDERLGEVGMAFVVTKSGAASIPDFTEWCRDQMANYKVPRAVEVVEELPLNATGKVMKDLLRERVASAHSDSRLMTADVTAGLSTFADLRVIELGVWVAAPSAAGLLADWGADVIKVEPPAGDPMRQVFGSIGIESDMPNPAFALDNRGKRSITLNLREPTDRQHLEELLATADVFISNLRPDSLDALDLEPAATVARHPQLVYCSMSGYGLRGNDRNRPTYDIGAFWARSGLSMQMADGEGNPLNARGGIGDHITGLAAVAGLLAAVLEQRATGVGRVVEVSLLRTGTYVLGWDLGLQLTLGKVARAESRDRNQAPLMNPYRTSDGQWFFLTGLEAARHIGAVCRALGHPELLDDPRFADAGSIRRNRVEVIAILDEIIAQETLATWAERFDDAGVWWALAHTPAQVVVDPQLIANDGIVEIDGGNTGTVQRSINGPVSFSGSDNGRRAAVPTLGQHTEEVLRQLLDRNSAP